MLIGVAKGTKSKFDFIVKYMGPRGRLRQPSHIHLIVDLLLKYAGSQELTLHLLLHFTTGVLMHVRPAGKFPPSLQVFKPDHASPFSELDNYGEYSTEFFLVVGELIAIQEKTNYPNGTRQIDLYGSFLDFLRGQRTSVDIYKLVRLATWRGNL